MMLHIDMSDFYIGVHSDASIKSFTSNRSGNFKTLLSKEIDLENIEYKVAISSITRYYETEFGDAVIVREKRQAKPDKQVDVVATYPKGDRDYKKLWEQFIASTQPILAYSDNPNNPFSVDLHVEGIKQNFPLFPKAVTESEFTKVSKSPIQNGIRFELSNLRGVGILTVIAARAVTKDVPFRLEFSAEFVKRFVLPQASYSGTLTAARSRMDIELRGKNKIPKFTDVRLTLPFILEMNDVLPGKSGFKYHLKLFEKENGALADYLATPFYGNSKSVSILEDTSQYNICILHP